MQIQNISLSNHFLIKLENVEVKKNNLDFKHDNNKKDKKINVLRLNQNP